MGILPGHWYYNTESGELTHGNNLENLGNNLFGGLGWHELNISGNATEAQAAAEARREFPKGKAPTTSLARGAVNSLANQTGSLLGFTGLSFHWRNVDNFLWRAAKVVLGGILLLAGIVKMTGANREALGVVAPVVSKVPGV